MKVYLSRQENGFYMITRLEPVKEVRIGDGKEALYVAYGDPFSFLHICPKIAEHLCGVRLEPLQSARVELTGVPL